MPNKTEHLKIGGAWGDAVKKASTKPRPAEGWPTRETRKYAKKKRAKPKRRG